MDISYKTGNFNTLVKYLCKKIKSCDSDIKRIGFDFHGVVDTNFKQFAKLFNFLHTKNISVYIISYAGFKRAREVIRELENNMENVYIKDKNIYIVGNSIYKYKKKQKKEILKSYLCNELKIDFFVDDNKYICEALSSYTNDKSMRIYGTTKYRGVNYEEWNKGHLCGKIKKPMYYKNVWLYK